jgi:hypothetical protein
MAKGLASDERNLNDQLADFTDRVMAGQAFQPSPPETPGILSDLQEVVLEIHRSVSHKAPHQELTGRLQRTLLNVWREELEQSASKQNLFSRITRIFSSPHTGWQSTSVRRRRLAGQIALATIIVLAILIPLAQSQGVLPGAATGETGTGIIIILLLTVGSLTAWILRDRKK